MRIRLRRIRQETSNGGVADARNAVGGRGSGKDLVDRETLARKEAFERPCAASIEGPATGLR